MDDESNVVSFPKEGRSSIRQEQDSEAARKKARCRHLDCTIARHESIITCNDCGAVVDPYDLIRKQINRVNDAIAYGAEKQRNDLRQEAKELSDLVRQLRGEFKDEMEKRRFQSQVAIKPPKRAKLAERI